MNWLKKIALNFVADYAKSHLTVANLQQWIAAGITALLQKAVTEKSQELTARICTACEQYGAVVSEVSKAAKDGTVTASEVQTILAKLQDATATTALTDEKIAELVDKFVAQIKERL